MIILCHFLIKDILFGSQGISQSLWSLFVMPGSACELLSVRYWLRRDGLADAGCQRCTYMGASRFCRFLAKSMWTFGKIQRTIRFVQVFQGFSSQQICENIRAGLADLSGIMQSSGDQDLTDFTEFVCFLLVLVAPKSMKTQLFPFIFKRTGPATMLKL